MILKLFFYHQGDQIHSQLQLFFWWLLWHFHQLGDRIQTAETEWSGMCMSKNQEYFKKGPKLNWLEIAWINTPPHPKEASQKISLVKSRDDKHRVEYKSNQIHSKLEQGAELKYGLLVWSTLG